MGKVTGFIEFSREVATRRPVEERLFGTIQSGLLPHFSGRTFANVVEKGDYDSEANASLTLSDLCWALLRWILDVYHNRPHEGLMGETPARAWTRLAEEYGVLPPPDAMMRRAVFGLARKARTEPSGIRFLGIWYNSQAIQDHRRKADECDLEIRIEAGDIGVASVRLPDGWHSVRATHPQLAGVHLDDWIDARKRLKQKFSDEAKLTEGIVFAALDEIRNLSKTARQRASIDCTDSLQVYIDRAEKELAGRFEFASREATGGPDRAAGVFDKFIDPADAAPDEKPPVKLGDEVTALVPAPAPWSFEDE